jgi:hypothetical protein
MKRTPLKRSTTRPKRRAVSPGSPAQRAKVKDEICIGCGAGDHCDPAHIVPRSLLGCDSALCVIPLCRLCHRAFDAGDFDLEPSLIGRCIPELQHALEHTNGSLTRLLRIVSGRR